MLEKEIEKKLKTEIKKLGGLCLKFTSPGFTGVPDRVVLLKTGSIFFVELKQKGKDLSPRQKFVRKQFEYLGHKVYKIDSIEQIKKLINDL